MTRLEHANLLVRALDATVRFVQSAFPEFVVRAEGLSPAGRRWLHLGTDTTYLALSEASVEPPIPWVPYSGVPGMNHLGYEVGDVAAVRGRLLAAGFRESTVPNAHPHRTRTYFYDPDGNDWEFIEYHSDDPAERNDYAHPDE
jgi:catechol 2,3-dioxygenase-like lactoylglutathione lyase family enzyme